jgi:hypothetical protein
MPKKTTDDPQSGLFDRVIENEALEASCARYLFTKPGAKDHGKAKRKLYEMLNAVEVKPGERVRIGRFVIAGKARKGGGFEVPVWERTGIGSVTELTD